MIIPDAVCQADILTRLHVHTCGGNIAGAWCLLPCNRAGSFCGSRRSSLGRDGSLQQQLQDLVVPLLRGFGDRRLPVARLALAVRVGAVL